MNIRIYFIVFIFLQVGLSAEWDFRGQLSLRGSGWKNNRVWYGGFGTQYIPNFLVSKELSSTRLIDFELAMYAFVNKEAGVKRDDFRPYRLNFRYATQQSEIQIGLQKINFGPAQLLRSLMWFDRQSPTDPMNIAEGVWGLRYRYNFLNNANIWLWGLYGNDDPKGWETYGSDKCIPEFGGRIQLPVPLGEFALTSHHRKISGSTYKMFDGDMVTDIQETRFALDGRWDVIVGAWFESVVQVQDYGDDDYFTKLLTLGTDYTLGIGNGLYVLGEHMISRISPDLTGFDQESQLSVVMLSYPLGLFDNIIVMGFYSWETEDAFQYISWQSSYDKIVLNLALFNFPDMQISTINTLGGSGAQLMLIYNH